VEICSTTVERECDHLSRKVSCAFDFGLGEGFADVDSDEVSSSPSPTEARIRAVIRSLSCDRAFSVDLDLGLDAFLLGPLVDFPGRLVASSFGKDFSDKYKNTVQMKFLEYLKQKAYIQSHSAPSHTNM
jgi:hypothetical protein